MDHISGRNRVQIKVMGWVLFESVVIGLSNEFQVLAFAGVRRLSEILVFGHVERALVFPNMHFGVAVGESEVG